MEIPILPYMGAIGMTYEQAGGGMGGLGVDTDHGYELTLVDRVAHHKTTGFVYCRNSL
jgi:hypothetical protein